MDIVNEILRWVTLFCLIYVGHVFCKSLTIPPEYRTNDKK